MHAVQLPEMKGHFTVAETALVVNEVNEGNPIASGLFREAMVKSDMPIAFNILSNKELIPQYAAYTPVWQEFSRRITLKDLTEQSYVEVWPDLSTLPPRENGRARIKNKAPRIGANNEYPAITLDESTVSVKADKYGLRMPLTIEMIINDQLDILANYPEALAVYMRTLEDIVTTEALIADNGQGIRGGITRIAANTEFGTTVNPTLSWEAVAAGLQQLANTEVNGVTANIQGARLIVPKQLELLARRIVGQPIIRVQNGLQVDEFPNPAAGLGVTVLEPLTWVNIAADAATTWFLTAGAAGGLAGRPSIVTTFVRGYENPQTFISSPNALTALGGNADWRDGSFRNDSIEFKVRHFTGAKIVLGEAIVASDGTND